MTTNNDESQERGRSTAESAPHPEQEHPEQDAHGGSMAPGLVDGTGHPTEEAPPGAAPE